MNIVFFVESYFHKPLMNGICVKKVADKLIEDGHNVTVFTSSENVYNIPSEEIVDGVKVFRIRRDLYTFLRLYLENHKDKPHKFLTFLKKYYGILLYIINFRYWPLKSFLTPLRYYCVAKKQLKNTKVDVIVGAYFHIEEVLAAIKLKKKYKNATLITYTLDAMTGRMTPKIFGKEEYARKSIIKWERYVFKKSDKICVMESHRSHYKNGSYETEMLNKIKYVDIPLLDVDENNLVNIPKAENPKKIVYAGTCTRETGSAKYLIELLKEIETVELHLYGKIDGELKTAISKSSLENKRIFFHGFVDHCVVEKAMENTDFLVTFGSCNDCMISGKIFEYMSKKKPIIAFYQIDNDANLCYLEKYPNVIIIKEYDNEYETDVKALSGFINRDTFIEIDNNYLKSIFYKNTPEAMVKEILN